MATDHNFRIKNGLEVGGVLIVNSSGALQVSPSTVSSNITLNDNVKLLFGNGSDLQIYHDGSNSYIDEAGTGELRLRSNEVELRDMSNEVLARFSSGGSSVLFYDNAEKFKTHSLGAEVEGQLWINDSNTHIKEGNGDSLRVQTPSGYIDVGPHNTSYAHMGTDRPQFYFNKKIVIGEDILTSYDADLQLQRVNSTKITLTSTGANVTGDLAVSGDLNITGDINSVSVTDLDIVDKTITVGQGQSASNSTGSGLIVSGANASMLWDNTDDRWEFNKDIYTSGNIDLGNARIYASGDSNSIHIHAPAAIIGPSTTTTSNPSLGTSAYRFDGVFSSTGSFSQSVTVGGDIIAADSNSSTNPSITFTGHTTTGLSVYQSNSVDRLSIITGGAQRANFGTHGVESFANVYTGNTSSFRNYAGTWSATTGVTGNGFSFINSVDGTALTLSATGNAVFSGTISSGAITSSGDFSTTGSITSTDGSGTFGISGDASSNTYLISTGEFRIRPSGTSVNKFVIGSNGNLTTAGTISSGDITANGSILGNGNLFLRSYNNDPKGIFFRDGFEYGDSNQYNLSITVFDDGDASADAMNINAYDGIYFNVQSGATPSTAFKILNSEVRSYKNFVSTGTVTATGGNSTQWNTAYGWGNYASAPNAPSITSTTVVNETIEIVFAASTSTGNTAATSYEVWSDGGTGTDYSLIAKIPYNDIASSMSVVDSSFDDSGTIAYRVYAIRHGAYSTAATTTRAFSMPTLDVSSMSVIPDTNNYYIQYELPTTRFIDHIEIYKDVETTSAALSRTGAALVYSGNNASYKYSIGSSDMEKYHQFWVEVVTV